MLSSKIADLVCLLTDDFPSFRKLSVNSLLVLDVNEWAQIQQSGSDQTQSPKWKELDEPVREKGSNESLFSSQNNHWRISCLFFPRKKNYAEDSVAMASSAVSTERVVLTYSNRDVNVLSKDNTLSLDDEEIDKLLGIVEETFEGRLGDDEVLAWADLRGEAIA